MDEKVFSVLFCWNRVWVFVYYELPFSVPGIWMREKLSWKRKRVQSKEKMIPWGWQGVVSVSVTFNQDVKRNRSALQHFKGRTWHAWCVDPYILFYFAVEYNRTYKRSRNEILAEFQPHKKIGHYQTCFHRHKENVHLAFSQTEPSIFHQCIFSCKIYLFVKLIQNKVWCQYGSNNCVRIFGIKVWPKIRLYFTLKFNLISNLILLSQCNIDVTNNFTTL